MKKIFLLFLLWNAVIIPILAQVNPKKEIKAVPKLDTGEPSVLVKVLPQTNVDIQWKPSMMVKVPGGSFNRKTNTFYPRITVSSFYMSKHEVTFNQYDAFCRATGRTKPGDNGWGRGNRPVINVTYIDAVDYCKWLSDSIKKTVRLPTEAEWEYAAVGITGIFTISENGYFFGDAKKGSGFHYSGLFKGGFNPDLVAWYAGNTSKTMPAGNKTPNKYGLYDMTGNVREWCHDIYSSNDALYKPDHYAEPSHKEDPVGPPGDIRMNYQRVIRGGGYRSDSLGCRLFIRQRSSSMNRNTDLGFRIVYTCYDCGG